MAIVVIVVISHVGPFEVLFDVSTAALAAAGLVREVVALLGPEILVSLSLGPAARPAAGL